MHHSKHFFPPASLPEGFKYPQSYVKFVESERASVAAYLGMPPWVFVGDEAWALEESLAVYGRRLVPFAQAEDEDMVAYFETSGSSEPGVLVGNPWEPNSKQRVCGHYESFSVWLAAAKAFSERLLAEKPHYQDREFWFPKNGV